MSGHYQVLFLFKNPDVCFPDNKGQVMKRLKHLERKFAKNPSFFEHYKIFIEDMIKKGYARVSKQTPEKGKYWYIPHHGVYHPAKPDKIRVVFDYSAEHQGTSVNNELIPGPDLRNQIIGVLLQFQQERVAFMADIKAMFYQVRILPELRSYLKFLWWKNSNNREEITDLEMCAHVFGGTSLPSCSNYALGHTSADNERQFGREASDTLRSFYVDDLLKSVNTVQEAVTLIRNVTGVCAAHGFNLTKFTSNTKEVMMAIPEAKHHKELENQDLVYIRCNSSGESPWNKLEC